MSRGSQQRRSANRNRPTNSLPYGYGGRRAETRVLPVRIIMSPTSSSRLLAGANARSATLLTTRSRTSPLSTLWDVPCARARAASRTAASLCDRRHGCQPGTVTALGRIPPALGDTCFWYVPARSGGVQESLASGRGRRLDGRRRAAALRMRQIGRG